MNEEAAFLRAILAAPDDPTPRLIYADWLEEQRDRRAELLRWDCELRDPRTDESRRETLRQWLRQQVQYVAADWQAQVARPTVVNCFGTNGSDCPTQWFRLLPTEQPEVRYCPRCRETVVCVARQADAMQQLQCGQRIALDRDWVEWHSSAERFRLFLTRLLGLADIPNSAAPEEPLLARLSGAFRHVLDAFLALPRPVILPQDQANPADAAPNAAPDAASDTSSETAPDAAPSVSTDVATSAPPDTASDTSAASTTANSDSARPKDTTTTTEGHPPHEP